MQKKQEDEIVQKHFKRDSYMYTSFENQCDYDPHDKGYNSLINYHMAFQCSQRQREDFSAYRSEILKGSSPFFKAQKESKNQTFIRWKLYDENFLYRPATTTIEYPAIKGYHKRSGLHIPIDSYIDKSDMDVLRNRYQLFMEKCQYPGIIEIAQLPVVRNRATAVPSSQTALIEIDFAMPLDEIKRMVEKMYKEFDKNPDKIQNIKEYLQLEPKRDILSFDLSESNLYEHKNKPLSGRLADILFIYDCKKIGLSRGYAIQEIIRYWSEVKEKIQKGFEENTYTKYLKME